MLEMASGDVSRRRETPPRVAEEGAAARRRPHLRYWLTAQACGELLIGAAAHASGDTPGQEPRILADIGYEIEELVRPVRDDLAFGMGGH